MRETIPPRAGRKRSEPARHLGERLARQCREGDPPPVAAMQLLMEAETPADAYAALAVAQMLQAEEASQEPDSSDTGASFCLHRIADLIERNPSAWQTVHRLARSIEHRPVTGDALAHWASLFDKLVRLSPEGSVALYSLGNPHLLADSTGEIVELLDHWGLLDPDSAALDIGCGIGRLEAALAPRIASVTGIDISHAMIEEACRRCGDLPNVRFATSSGRDLEGIADESVNLVLLIDTLPYLILSGSALAARLCAESARVLTPGGSLLILNATYGGDADADLAEIAQLAEGASLEFHRADWRPLRSWDAPAFQLTKVPPQIKRAARSRA